NEVQAELDEPREEITSIIEALETMQEEVSMVEDFTKDIEEFAKDNEAMFDQLQASLSEMEDIDLSYFVEEYESSIEPAILAELSKAQATVEDAKSMLHTVEEAIPKVEEMITTT